eukprot:4605523-Pyramimonas_sp.AAC.1
MRGAPEVWTVWTTPLQGRFFIPSRYLTVLGPLGAPRGRKYTKTGRSDSFGTSDFGDIEIRRC